MKRIVKETQTTNRIDYIREQMDLEHPMLFRDIVQSAKSSLKQDKFR